jgi:hypothetical protein
MNLVNRRLLAARNISRRPPEDGAFFVAESEPRLIGKSAIIR